MAALLAGPAWAQDRAAPGYYIEALVATTAAQQLALACPQVSVNPVNAKLYAEEVMARLEADGFDLTAPDLGMSDATGALEAQRLAFLNRHGLGEGAAQDVVCTAARAEIAEGGAIGHLLLEAGQ